ncbi:helix-turn-helix domain-containing protein [Aquimarina longa]|uniref:helix-turn-helix domain-containing protein n=1 Tax=Aquimarina longa TaxID=1080221 RepID=UPI000784A9E0|nr:response regulator transcription factor [Aquimarina longa]
MKRSNYISILLLFLNISLFGQNCVSGYVTIEKPNQWDDKVYLSKVIFEGNTNTYTTLPIASSPLKKDGFFKFDKNLFTEKNHIYKIQLNPLTAETKKRLSTTIKNFRLFIVSKNDTIFFNKEEKLFATYTTDNNADREWQKLKNFEAKYENLTSDFDTKKYLLETKGYVKDSLQILLVKLIGIKKLDDQNLLDKDIKANPEYYISLLKELKSSELESSTYAYLENKLAILNQQITTQKYHISLWTNGVMLIIILSLTLIKSRKKVVIPKPIPLSKQEKAVKDLIVCGKSNKEIANELFISLSTVKTHITNIYSKLNISNRQDLLLKK